MIRAAIMSVVLAGSATVSLAQASQALFTLAIAAGKADLPVGTDVFVRVTETNISDHVLERTWTDVNGTNMNYHFEITDAQGRHLARLKGTRGLPGSSRRLQLSPGVSHSTDNYLSWLYDLGHPGTYTIVVWEPASNSDSDGIVKSNAITITISPQQ